MFSINATNLRSQLFKTLERAIRFNEPVNVTTKDGNAVILSESDYNSLVETVYLTSVPGLREAIQDGLKTPLSDCIPESEVQW